MEDTTTDTVNHHQEVLLNVHFQFSRKLQYKEQNEDRETLKKAYSNLQYFTIKHHQTERKTQPFTTVFPCLVPIHHQCHRLHGRLKQRCNQVLRTKTSKQYQKKVNFRVDLNVLQHFVTCSWNCPISLWILWYLVGAIISAVAPCCSAEPRAAAGSLPAVAMNDASPPGHDEKQPTPTSWHQVSDLKWLLNTSHYRHYIYRSIWLITPYI